VSPTRLPERRVAPVKDEYVVTAPRAGATGGVRATGKARHGRSLSERTGLPNRRGCRLHLRSRAVKHQGGRTRTTAPHTRAAFKKAPKAKSTTGTEQKLPLTDDSSD